MASGFRADMDFRVGGSSFRSFRLWLRVRDVAGVRVCFVPQVRSGFSVSGFGMFKVLGVLGFRVCTSGSMCSFKDYGLPLDVSSCTA